MKRYKPIQAVHLLLYTICIGVCIMFLCSFSPNQSIYIKWSEDRRLQVSDYQVGSWDLEDAVAITTSGIKMIWDSRLKRFRAYAVFNMAESYWNEDEIKDEEYVLNHEQLHFDLAHYMASELDKRLSKKGITRSEMIKLYNQYFEMLDTIQDSYDEETDHGIIRSKQTEWNRIVANLIEDTK